MKCRRASRGCGANKMGRSGHNRKRLNHAKKLLRSRGQSFVGTTKGVARALKDADLVPASISSGQALETVFSQDRKLTKNGLLPAKSVSDFYQTKAWKALAYRCKLRDGRKCMCCGATPEDGARIVSDHIKPVRLRWDLRLDPNNIQTLCDDCNLGKGSTDQTDFTLEA